MPSLPAVVTRSSRRRWRAVLQRRLDVHARPECLLASQPLQAGRLHLRHRPGCGPGRERQLVLRECRPCGRGARWRGRAVLRNTAGVSFVRAARNAQRELQALTPWRRAQQCAIGPNACDNTTCVQDFSTCATGQAGGSGWAFTCPLSQPPGALPNGAGAYCYDTPVRARCAALRCAALRRPVCAAHPPIGALCRGAKLLHERHVRQRQRHSGRRGVPVRRRVVRHRPGRAHTQLVLLRARLCVTHAPSRCAL